MEMRKVDFSPVYLGESEIEIVRKTILSGWITTGPVTKEFEKEIALGLQISTTKSFSWMRYLWGDENHLAHHCAIYGLQ